MNDTLQEAYAIIDQIGERGRTYDDRRSYAATKHKEFETLEVRLDLIEPIVRGPGVPDFFADRAKRILEHFESKKPLDPVVVTRTRMPSAYEYKLEDGHHRYYLSRAVGFTHIFVAVMPCAEYAEGQPLHFEHRIGSAVVDVMVNWQSAAGDRLEWIATVTRHGLPVYEEKGRTAQNVKPDESLRDVVIRRLNLHAAEIAAQIGAI